MMIVTTGAATPLYSSSSPASRLDDDDSSFFTSKNKFNFATVEAGLVESSLFIRFIAVLIFGMSPLVYRSIISSAIARYCGFFTFNGLSDLR